MKRSARRIMVPTCRRRRKAAAAIAWLSVIAIVFVIDGSVFRVLRAPPNGGAIHTTFPVSMAIIHQTSAAAKQGATTTTTTSYEPMVSSKLSNVSTADLQQGGGEKEETTNTFLSFVRVPKTGSTSLMIILRDYSGLESLFTLQELATLTPDGASTSLAVAKNGNGHQRAKTWRTCLFGPLLHVNATVRQQFMPSECGHWKYLVLHKRMEKEIAKLRTIFQSQSTATTSSGLSASGDNTIKNGTSSVAGHAKQAVAITPPRRHYHHESIILLRDPFDRLRSMFDYLHYRAGREVWKQANTAAQYERVRSGDFAGWLELMYKEENVPLGKQYQFLADNVNTAISYIVSLDRDDHDAHSKNVTVLLNECFDASVRLLQVKLALKPGAADKFLDSQRVVNNASKGTTRNGTDFEYLRKQSRRYFPDEYKFYNAAVKQFKLLLDSFQLGHHCDL